MCGIWRLFSKRENRDAPDGPHTVVGCIYNRFFIPIHYGTYFLHSMVILFTILQ